MKITKLIQVFKKCIPIYQKAVDKNLSYSSLIFSDLQRGICNFCTCQLSEDVYDVFQIYYTNYTMPKSGYLFKTSNHVTINIIEKCIKPRLEFLKQQVIELNKLLKQGYTHV